MDDIFTNDSLDNVRRPRHEVSEPESENSPAGSHQMSDTEENAQILGLSTLSIRPARHAEISDHEPEEGSNEESRTTLETTSENRRPLDESQSEGSGTPINTNLDYGHTAALQSRLSSQPASFAVEAERNEPRIDAAVEQVDAIQPSHSTEQSLPLGFDSERNAVGRSASESELPQLSDALNDPQAYQYPSTIVPVADPNSPRLRSGDGRDIVLPRWQPDAEVTYCPICRTQFSFFVRKHHCRKCGRVVCHSCSPHRITIPYQFIVQQPPAMLGSQIEQSTSIRESESVLDRQTGGMKVRLCNPCVPDPNTIPPQQPPGDVWRGGTQPTYYLNSGNRGYAFGEAAMTNLERSSNSFARDSPARVRGLSTGSGLSSGDRREQTMPIPYGGRAGTPVYNSSNSSTHTNYPSTQGSRYSNQTASHNPRPLSMIAPPLTNSGRGHTRGNQSLSFNPTSSASNSNPQPHYRSLLDVDNQRAQPSNLDSRPLPAVPRIPEEDECPVCHRELPSRTLPNFEDARAAHITQCIEDQIAVHNGQGRPGAYTSQSQPGLSPHASRLNAPLPPISQSGASSSTQTTPARASASYQPISPEPTVPLPAPIANTPEARMEAREQAHARVVLGLSQSNSPANDIGRRTGMFLYKASEKDCVDDAECTICLEEFEVAVGMARLECLCRFHAKCIRAWFVDHPGRCPVHQHDGYGF